MKLLFISILTLLSTSFAVSEELLTAEVFTYEKTLSALQSDTVQFRQLSLLSDTSVWHCVLENGKDITAEGKLQLSTKDETKVFETKFENFEVPIFFLKRGSTAGRGTKVIMEFGWDYVNPWIVVTNHSNRKQKIVIKIYKTRKKFSYE